MFFVSAGQVHYWHTEEPLQGYSLHFLSELLASGPAPRTGVDTMALLHSLSYAPLHLDGEQAAFVQQLMEMVVHEYEAYEYDSVVCAYLHILFSHIKRYCECDQPATSITPAAELTIPA